MNGLIKGMAAASLGWLAIGNAANAQAVAQPGQPVAGQPAAAQPGGAGNHDNGKPGDMPGPIDSVQDIEDTGKMLFKLADTDNNGQISQKEAVDAGNLIAGGFFFRADQNGDGTLSREEVQSAREALFRQQPMLRFLIQRGRAGAQQAAAANPGGNNAAAGAAAGNQAAGNPAATIGNLLDTNNDKQLQASEVRQAIQTAVQAGFASADTNRDNQLTPSEINSALLGVGRAVARAGFQAADSDNNGQMSRAEFDKAIVEPANVVFGVFDANGDSQISPQEMQSAAQLINSQLRSFRVPDGTPANVPNFRTPEEGGLGRPGAAGAPGAAAPAGAPATAPQPR